MKKLFASIAIGIATLAASAQTNFSMLASDSACRQYLAGQVASVRVIWVSPTNAFTIVRQKPFVVTHSQSLADVLDSLPAMGITNMVLELNDREGTALFLTGKIDSIKPSTDHPYSQVVLAQLPLPMMIPIKLGMSAGFKYSTNRDQAFDYIYAVGGYHLFPSSVIGKGYVLNCRTSIKFDLAKGGLPVGD